YPGRARDAEYRRQVQRHGSPEAGAFARQVRCQPCRQPTGEREQQNERQPYDDRRLGAKQMCRGPTQPPCRRRMIVIAQAQHAARGNHVTFVNTQSGGRGEAETQRGGDQDQRPKLASHADSLLLGAIASLYKSLRRKLEPWVASCIAVASIACMSTRR